MENGRLEYKYGLSLPDALELKSRLAPFTEPDPHAVRGEYRIRSLYFDTPDGDAFREKSDGSDERVKYRLRYYNGDTSFFHLEKKEKDGMLCRKAGAAVDKITAAMLAAGEYECLQNTEDPLLKEFYAVAKAAHLQPAVTVEYRRAPFLYRYDNVRITIDTDVRAGRTTDFLLKRAAPFPAMEPGTALLEVKTDDRLPVFLGRLLEDVRRQPQSFSKFALCYGILYSRAETD